MAPESAAVAKPSYSTGLLETVSNTQRVELTSAKENVLSSFSSKIQEFKDQFNSSVAALEEDEREEGKKKAYDKFIFSLTALKNQLPAFSAKFESFVAKNILPSSGNLRNLLKKKIQRARRPFPKKYPHFKKYMQTNLKMSAISSREI